VLAVLTSAQAGIYRNLEVLWRDTLAYNPTCWMAHDDLGLYLTGVKQFDEAETHYGEAIRISGGAVQSAVQMAFSDTGLIAEEAITPLSKRAVGKMRNAL